MRQRDQSFGPEARGAGSSSARLLLVSAVLLLGGCSADLGRFDFPGSGLSARDSKGPLLPPEPVGGSYAQGSDREPEGDGGRSPSYSGGTYVPPRAERPSRGVEMAALPEPSRGDGYDRGSARAPSSYRETPPPAVSSPASAPSSAPSSSGGLIEVQRGDTLYGLARRHGVNVKALMAANNLTSTALKPGQQLRLPGGASHAESVPARQERSQPAPAPRLAEASSSAPADWHGTHTVKSGESPYSIARQYGIKVAELQSANGITNPRQLKLGMVLRVPGNGGDAPTGAPATGSAPAPVAGYAGAPTPAETAPRVIQSTTKPTMINGGEQKVAALESNRASDAAGATAVQSVSVTPVSTAIGKLRWPARGKVLSGFGQRSDGTHNDGINIAVPKGADVHAAEDGEVAYAGSELKGYGNLVLIRHDNGWVTAYAHNDTVMVKRGDKVKRGDVLAKAGSTGQVDKPQLHFELRQGSKPVDPLPYLERL